MKQAAVIFALIMVVFTACDKGGSGGGGTPPPPTEANLVVTTDPAINTVVAPSLGPFNLKVTITSTMPPNGVKIEVNAKKDDGSGSAAFYTTSVNTSTSINNFTITNTPSTVQCLVEIKVTSLTKATNTWTGSYRYSLK